MNSDREEAETSGRFHTVQPLRDLESNWAVDLAKNLEGYLLKICSGEITGDDNANFSVNFSEAALLLQGSIQVYSRKVEYLYSLVLHALEFISQKRQLDQPEGISVQPEENGSHAVLVEENDQYWGLDDIPVEDKISLYSSTCKYGKLNQFVRPPVNLVVLEGDCLDATGDGSELESYLLATSDLYRDFILLDPCDAVAVDNYSKDDKAGKWQNGICRGNSMASKSRKSFQSPINRSGGATRKSSAGKNQDANLNRSPTVDHGFEFSGCNIGPDHPSWSVPDNNIHGFEMDDGYSEPGDLDDSDDEEDPWKPLNPHEPGNLRVKPFKKVKSFRRQGINSTKRVPITKQFPLARMHGTISPELSEVWEARRHASESQHEPKSLPLYEKLRHSLVHGGRGTSDEFGDPRDYNEDDEYDTGGPDFGPPDFDMPDTAYEYEEIPLHPEKRDDNGVGFDTNEMYGPEGPSSQANLEDLCRSHLDALLASIAESEKQTELAVRVSTWKQRIEENLEEQDSRPPFNIHEYGERVLEKLSVEGDSGNITMSFAEVVRGQEKHDVATLASFWNKLKYMELFLFLIIFFIF
ncbi:Condensin-2 complex subunit like [Actinidia chinensis var. chinensis]|uniref:Condensin-2 complex subunit H2 n=1 Tax=Actinidia chinensis var. chinensis TaxID=1590841 RepID=A0A2R6P4C2_ACTCC|nr:Condensin-2 complex subunit like [Actinidia chinensis var. chinensis]